MVVKNGPSYVIKYCLFTMFTLKFCHSSDVLEDLHFGKVYVGQDFVPLFGQSLMQCQEHCARRPKCKSINYRRFSPYNCELISQLAPSDNDFTDNPGWVYQARSEWETETVCTTCSTGQFCDVTTNQCVYKECDFLVENNNLRILGNINSVGAKAILACQNGKYPASPGTLTAWPVQTQCQNTGTWTVASLQCIDYQTVIGTICKEYLVGPASVVWTKFELRDVELVSTSTSCGVSNDRLTASSFHDNNPIFAPEKAKFDQSGVWIARIHTLDPEPYVQVQFDAVLQVKAIKTKGRNPGDQYTKTFSVYYSADCLDFTSSARDATGNTVFTGNINDISVVDNVFQTPIFALCVRIYPLTYNIPIPVVTYPSLQFELIGTLKLPVI